MRLSKNLLIVQIQSFLEKATKEFWTGREVYSTNTYTDICAFTRWLTIWPWVAAAPFGYAAWVFWGALQKFLDNPHLSYLVPVLIGIGYVILVIAGVIGVIVTIVMLPKWLRNWNKAKKAEVQEAPAEQTEEVEPSSAEVFLEWLKARKAQYCFKIEIV